MKVWSRAGSKNSTTNSQRAKRRGESKKKRKCQRGDPEQASTSRLFPYEGCKLLPPPQGRKVLFSKLNPLNPSRTEREETEEVQGPTATWGASVGVLKKSKAEAATMHKYGPLSVVESLSHIFAKHHNQRPTRDRLSMFPAPWRVSKCTIRDPPASHSIWRVKVSTV